MASILAMGAGVAVAAFLVWNWIWEAKLMDEWASLTIRRAEPDLWHYGDREERLSER